MSGKKKLGRGLDKLLSGSNRATAPESAPLTPPSPEEQASSTKNLEPADGDLRYLPVEWVHRGKYQPRTDMHEDALQELAESIRSQGVMQPIVVRPMAAEKFEIIAGERRWRATQIAGLDTIPAIIKTVSDESAVAMALIENIQRENLNPIEEAMALKRLQDEFELTQQEVANAVGKSRATVTNLLRLMSLNPDVRKMLEHGDLEMGHARALLSLSDDEQSDTAKIVVGKGMSVRQTEALVRKIQSGVPSKPEPERKDPDIRHLEEDLSQRLGGQVQIRHSARGKGKLTIAYNSLDELDGILGHIK